MARDIKVKLYADEEIQSKLDTQRSQIEGDVDKTIEAFLKTSNRTAGRSLMRAINGFSPPQEGFEVWKKHFETPDDHALQDEFRGRKFSKTRVLSEIWAHKANDQRINGVNPNGVMPTFKRVTGGFVSLAVSSLLGEMKGGLNANKTMIMGGMATMQGFTDGPLNSGDPLLSTVMPHMREAIAEKYASTLERLQQAVKSNEPILEEDFVWSLRDEVLEKAAAKFERLAAQTYGDQSAYARKPLDFDADSVPKDATFGIEMEGVLASPDSFAVNMMNMQAGFRAMGLESKLMGIMPKKNKDKYDKWNVVFDPSVQNPIYFTNQQDSQNKVLSVGMEVVSPILRGPKGIKDLQAATDVMNAFRFRTNETCGMHIHIDLNDTTLEQRKNLAKALKRNEAEIDGYVERRRGHGSVYAKSFDGIPEEAIDAAQDDAEFVSAVNPDNDRDFKFDFTGLVLPDAPRTLQLRGEGGAGYLGNIVGYAAVMINFAAEAKDNPDVTLDNVIERMSLEKAAREAQNAVENTKAEPANDSAPDDAIIAKPDDLQFG